jgi:hypothetical protein
MKTIRNNLERNYMGNDFTESHGALLVSTVRNGSNVGGLVACHQCRMFHSMMAFMFVMVVLLIRVT